MMDEIVVNQWSGALFQLAKDIKKINKYFADSNVLIDILGDYPDFLDIVSSNNLELEVRKEIVIKVFKKNAEIYMLNFLLLLLEKDYFRYVRYILKDFRKLCNDYNDISFGIIYSVVQLSDQQIKQIKNKVEKIINHKIQVVNIIDKTLIGGVKVKVQNQVFDGSVKGQLENLKQELLNHE